MFRFISSVKVFLSFSARCIKILVIVLASKLSKAAKTTIKWQGLSVGYGLGKLIAKLRAEEQ